MKNKVNMTPNGSNKVPKWLNLKKWRTMNSQTKPQNNPVKAVQ